MLRNSWPARANGPGSDYLRYGLFTLCYGLFTLWIIHIMLRIIYAMDYLHSAMDYLRIIYATDYLRYRLPIIFKPRMGAARDTFGW